MKKTKLAKDAEIPIKAILPLALFVLLAALYNEFFQTPAQLISHTQKIFVNPLNSPVFGQITQLKIQNKNGELMAQKEQKLSDHYWFITSPKKMLAKSEIIEAMIDQIKNFQIMRTLKYDDINLANFSLSPPLSQISFFDQQNKDISFFFGLVNPIDNSFYFHTTNKRAIYQSKGQDHNFISAGLNDLVENRVFLPQIKNINQIEVFYNYRTYTRQVLHIEKQAEQWVDNKKRKLDEKKVNDYLNKLASYTSTIILDHIQTPEEGDLIDSNHLEVRLWNKTEQIQTYKIYESFSQKDLKINTNSKDQVLIVSPIHISPMLVDKGILNAIKINEQSLMTSKYDSYFY